MYFLLHNLLCAEGKQAYFLLHGGETNIVHSGQRGNKRIFFYKEGKNTVSSAMRGHRRNDIESYLVLQGNFTRTNELENTYK